MERCFPGNPAAVPFIDTYNRPLWIDNVPLIVSKYINNMYLVDITGIIIKKDGILILLIKF